MVDVIERLRKLMDAGDDGRIAADLVTGRAIQRVRVEDGVVKTEGISPSDFYADPPKGD